MKPAFWIRGTYIFQLATGIIHSMSFLAEQQAANATEKQLLELMNGYSMDMGAGFHRSMGDIFMAVSACMTLLCFFSGIINLLLFRKAIGNATLKQVMLVNALVFGIGLIVMLRFAFLPPIVCFGLIFLCSAMSFYSLPKSDNS